jgi:predicted RNase H-like HicB family nuclease
MPTVTFTLNLPATFEREGDMIVARFPDIDVASQGATKEEATRNLIEAAQLFIESCFERNVLDEVLKECGFTPGHAGQQPTQDHLTVPVELLLAVRNGSSNHAC